MQPDVLPERLKLNFIGGMVGARVLGRNAVSLQRCLCPGRKGPCWRTSHP